MEGWWQTSARVPGDDGYMADTSGETLEESGGAEKRSAVPVLIRAGTSMYSPLPAHTAQYMNWLNCPTQGWYQYVPGGTIDPEPRGGFGGAGRMRFGIGWGVSASK